MEEYYRRGERIQHVYSIQRAGRERKITVEELLRAEPDILRTLTWSTEPLCIRVRGVFKAVYKRYIAPDRAKREIFKESVEQVILELSRIGDIVKEPHVTINISPSITIENRIENKINVENNLMIVLAEIKGIAERLYRIAKASPSMPEKQRKLIYQLYEKVSKLDLN